MYAKRIAAACVVAATLVGVCSTAAQTAGAADTPATARGATPAIAAVDPAAQLRWLDRVTWGASDSSAQQLQREGLAPWLASQLHPAPAVLPAAAQAQIDAMTITRTPLEVLAASMQAQRRSADASGNDEQKREARKAYQQELTRLGREAQTRFLLRALYSPNQLQEQMVWFWMNHFNVNARKNNIRATIGDYEETAIRPNALGKFRTLLGATLRHPAMLRYLDNARNAANRVNENYARELMELHTLGVDGGYSQTDVQELARVLTGVGIDARPADAPVRQPRGPRRADYVKVGAFEFNPNRHDYGAKALLGQPITASGMAEVDEALDRLARAPATARFISNKLAVYFVSDQPPKALVDRMAAAFQRSDGDIAAVLQTMFESPEFSASLGDKFRDPVHYVMAGVRLAYDQRVANDLAPALGWLSRMGEPLYGHETPDGYSLKQVAWSSSGQMAIRFEIARIIGSRGAVLFRSEADAPLEKPPYPALARADVVSRVEPGLSATTRDALAKATSPQDWNTYLLASPEFMRR
ncbi:MAG: DUF1800 domain-containing protein [Variovorax sp.]